MIKINGPAVTQANPYNKKTEARPPAGDSFAAKLDQIEISSAAKTMQAQAARPSERAARIQEIRQQVQAGTFRPDAERTAGSLASYYRM